MRSRFAWCVSLAGFGLTLVLLSGCARREAPVESGITSQTFHVAISAEPRDLDPQVLVAFNDMKISLALFEGITAVDEATSRPIPGIAEHWTTSADGLTWTFVLRENLRWSDGQPLTADDVVFSLQRVLSPRLGSEYAYVLFTVVGAEDYNSGRTTDPATLGVRAADARTVVITLTQPTPGLPAILALPTTFPVPRHVILQHGGADERSNRWTRPENLVGNGPFRVKEWTPNQRVVTERNPHHRENAANALNGVVFYPYDSAAAQEAAFRAGQVHLTSEVPVSKIAAYRQGPDAARLRADPFLETWFFRFNTSRPPLDRPLVRQALARAIDRQALTTSVTLGGQTPAHTLVPPGTAGYAGPEGIREDFETARRLLAEAGFPQGRGFPRLEIMSFSGEMNQRVMEAIQQMWRRELGIDVTLAVKEQRVWLDDERQKNYDVSYARWIGDYVDPSTFLELFMSNSGNNATGWSNATYDQLVRQAGAGTTPDQRHGLYRQAETLLLDETPIAPIYHGTLTFLIHPAVTGWEPALLGFHRYQKVKLQATK